MTHPLTPIRTPASADINEAAADLRARFDAGQFATCPPETRAALLGHIRMLALVVDDVEALEWAVANPEPVERMGNVVPLRPILPGSDCHRRPEYGPGPEAA